MVKIIFKNVGQGDSIILQWTNGNQTELAVIDCAINVQLGTNPVLDHISKIESPIIKYLFLSHPHLDHFSGYIELLNFLEEEKIPVSYFLHTCNQVPDFLRTAVKGIIAERELQNLFIKLRTLEEQSKIKVATLDANNLSNKIQLKDSCFLTCQSPTIQEFDKYILGTNLPYKDKGKVNNSNANWLSTIFSIEGKDSYGLLTSDAEKYSLIRVDKSKPDVFLKKLLFGQSPHHGSLNNHNNTFWKKRKSGSKRPKVAFSVGKNQYTHPSPKVVEFFSKESFEINSTNKVGGMQSITSQRASSELDVFSIEIPDSNLNGDIIFEVQ